MLFFFETNCVVCKGVNSEIVTNEQSTDFFKAKQKINKTHKKKTYTVFPIKKSNTKAM